MISLTEAAAKEFLKVMKTEGLNGRSCSSNFNQRWWLFWIYLCSGFQMIHKEELIYSSDQMAWEY